ncbi:MAG: hypothetical protein ACPH9N_02495 [Alteromonas sp.]
MAALDKDQVIEKFTKAYTAQNGKAPTIEAKGGWYSVDGGKNMRLAALDELADSMGGEAPAEKPAAEAKPKAEKNVTKAAKPAAKKASKPKAKSTFSVKAAYNAQIQADNPGAILPR